MSVAVTKWYSFVSVGVKHRENRVSVDAKDDVLIFRDLAKIFFEVYCADWNFRKFLVFPKITIVEHSDCTWITEQFDHYCETPSRWGFYNKNSHDVPLTFFIVFHSCSRLTSISFFSSSSLLYLSVTHNSIPPYTNFFLPSIVIFISVFLRYLF